jgi:hypothetical protein
MSKAFGNHATLVSKGIQEQTVAQSPDVLWGRLQNPAVPGTFLDGVWTPRSLDLSAELPPLVIDMMRAGHDVSHVIYNPMVWNVTSRVLTIGRQRVMLGGFRDQDEGSISLIDTSRWQRLDLLVIQPRTDFPVSKPHRLS